MELKWRKLPSPEKLAALPRNVAEAGIPFLQRIAPALQRKIIDRVRAGRAVGLDGEEIDIPPASSSYQKWLKAVGLPQGKTDYVMRREMLRKLSAKITVKQGQLKLIIAGYGRIKRNMPQLPKGVRTWKREGYTTTSRSGKQFQVPPTTITQLSVNPQALGYQRKLERLEKERAGKLIYNAHLWWHLSRRAGHGRYSYEPTHHPLGISNKDLASLRDQWLQALSASGALSVWEGGNVNVRG